MTYNDRKQTRGGKNEANNKKERIVNCKVLENSQRYV